MDDNSHEVIQQDNRIKPAEQSNFCIGVMNVAILLGTGSDCFTATVITA